MGVQSGRSGGVGTGRTPLNPQNCPRVTHKNVLKIANLLGVLVRREGKGMWFRRNPPQETWFTLGQTNYIALSQLSSEQEWMTIYQKQKIKHLHDMAKMILMGSPTIDQQQILS